ncbi:helicase associated domain-containing protein [Streptomyces sp. NPDC126499]|uniref:helicase associated domain-containing protein n=1 Tax=Streptomyces sp. NPDC126499 TaxID=3155314 RepID=UPI00331693F3
MDIGKWLARQRQPEVWEALSDGQRERLEQLGITPLAPVPELETSAKPSTTPLSTFEKGVAALAQWVEREGARRPVPRGHAEEIAVDVKEPGVVKLGVWVSMRMGLEHQVEARQAHPGAAGRTAAAGCGMGLTRGCLFERSVTRGGAD